MAEIKMPQLGETVTEGTITKWFKQVGDQVAEDEPLYEVSTDKVDSEVPSPESGYLAEIRVPEGETVEVGAVLAVISDAPGQAGGAAEPAAAGQQAPEEAPAEAAPQPAQAQAPPPEPAPPPAADNVQEEAPAAAPAADVSRAEEPPAPAAPATPPPQPAPEGGGPSGDGDARTLLSPVVRRLISEHNLDPSGIPGTGAGGRITRNDVLAVVEQRDPRPEAAPAPAAPAAPAAPQQAPAQPPAPAPAAAAPPPQPQPAAPPAAARPQPQPAPAARAGERDEVVPFTNIRRRTAEHMVRSLATSAHTLVAVEADFSAVDVVRRARRESFRAEEGFGLTYLPFVGRAVIDAIAEFPNINASVGDDQLVVHRYVNLGIAVDLDFEGLVAPVVKDADTKRLRAIAREISELARRARSKQLSPDDIAGGTFTITNPGPFGTFITAPIINQPQVAILSTDGVRKRPVVVELPDGTDGIAIHPVGMLALSFDHRAIDGAYASAYVARVKEIVETRDWDTEL
jgi:pyruvate dehydrogenase E2 component (dihydrolipoamide acetyltransferase)